MSHAVRSAVEIRPLPPLLTSITLQGLLSYGPHSPAIPLTALNVLIGANGVGKSNMVEALALLRSLPKDLALSIRQGGRVTDWLWRDDDSSAGLASLGIVLPQGLVAEQTAVRYHLAFGTEGVAFGVLDERVDDLPEGGSPRVLYFGIEDGRPVINAQKESREIPRASLDPTQSILSQRRDPEAYPELTRLGDLLRRILIYRSWQFGPESVVRRGCRADVRTDALAESLDNLPARLAVLLGKPAIKRRLIELVGDLAPGFDDLAVIPEGGSLQLYLIEGSRSVAAHRLSDGTLRYLCLLAILLDPDPPPLMVIEEPELGLHPDVLPTLRDLMVAASERTQLVVTTHSPQMIDAMTDFADSVLVCDKQGGGTTVTRLNQAEVDRWREHGSLGALWMSGHLGGTRW